jgi:CBS domain-containing protein
MARPPVDPARRVTMETAVQKVEDVMTRSVITIAPETPIPEVARLLLEHGVSGLPVVTADGRILGVISEGDLLVKEAGLPRESGRPLSRLFGAGRPTREQQEKVDARTAGDAMTSPAITVGAAATVQSAAGLMTDRRVNRLPVVDADGRLVGIVTRADLVRAFVRSDADLVEAVRGDVLRATMWLDPDAFEVTASDGVVRIAGAVQRRSTAEMLVRFIRTVPGVVSVDPAITWSLDDRDIEAPSPDLLSPYDI